MDALLAVEYTKIPKQYQRIETPPFTTNTEMPHQTMPERLAHGGLPRRLSEEVNAYLVGGGIASLAAAVHLIQDAQVPANQIHILESGQLPGGSMDGAGTAEKGYVLRGGRMLNFSYLCTYDLLSKVPSLTNEEKSIKQEIDEFNAVPGNKTHAHARLVASGKEGPQIMDVTKMGFHWKDREDLLKVAEASEKSLGTKRIDECFRKEFFETEFWFMWGTTFAFEPWHSAVEFKRYLHRFVQEFPRINTLAGVDRTPLNQYDSIILPIETYLKAQGVDFRYDTQVTNLSFMDKSTITVSEIHFTSPTTPSKTGIIHVHEHDLIFVTLGSMTSSSSLGTNETPPSPLPSPATALSAPDGSWKLWTELANPETNPHYAHFGNPSNFYTRVEESNWLSFTTTLSDPTFFEQYEKWSGNKAGTGALVTFKDSNWLMSIVVPHQPHFLHQPANVQVFWGYGLFPSRHGNFVPKPMAACSGREILTELLGHLDFHFSHDDDDQNAKILASAITIPCMMPYITSQFLTRGVGDRPEVVPHGSANLALVGQFVEIPRDTVFTVEYSVRAAQMAVHAFMGTKEGPRDVYRGEHDVKVLVDGLRMLLT